MASLEDLSWNKDQQTERPTYTQDITMRIREKSEARQSNAYWKEFRPWKFALRRFVEFGGCILGYYPRSSGLLALAVEKESPA